MLEIEKTFLVKKMPDLAELSRTAIRQGYLSPAPSPLRIRQKGDKYELTKKLPLAAGDYSQAEEINIPLTKLEFDKLWPLCERSLEKKRYLIDLQAGLMAELDVFAGALTGLQLVEVEFANAEAMNDFIPPEWFGKDITQEDYSSNSFLAGRTFAEIRKFLN